MAATITGANLGCFSKDSYTLGIDWNLTGVKLLPRPKIFLGIKVLGFQKRKKIKNKNTAGQVFTYLQMLLFFIFGK